MSESAHTAIRVVLRPDRRQNEDRRAQNRGGRRASDQPAFAISSTAEADELWEIATDWAPQKLYVH